MSDANGELLHCLHPDWCGGSDLCKHCRVGSNVDCCDRGCHADESWTERWSVLLECKRCKVHFEVEHPDPSAEFVAGSNRLVLVGAPNRCPRCSEIGRLQATLPSKVVDIRARSPAG